MRLALVLGFIFCVASMNASAEGEGIGQTSDYCSLENQAVCAHLKFLNVLSTKTEGHLIAHVVVPSNQPVENLRIDLWMDMGGHGHGSAPVDITDLNETNHFQIKNAWFVMKGTWLVRIDFDLNDEHYHLEIPVEVTQ